MRRNILITGASSGLGAEMARVFARNGHRLALTARRTERMNVLRGEILSDNPDAHVIVASLDVNDHEAVFAVFKQLAADLGGLDRVIVNAGLGSGGRIGSGHFEANRQTATTNFVSALAQCEAAMEHFYERKSGHLVVVSSMSAMRGLSGSMTSYSASKAGIAHLAEGIRMDQIGRKDSDIKVTTLFPGYIESEMSAGAAQDTPMMVDTETGVRAMVKAIDAEVGDAAVPRWPWAPVGKVLRHAPLPIVRRLI